MTSPRAVLEECTAAVREIIRAHRARGQMLKEALQPSADAIGITAGRVKKYWDGRVAAVPAHEADAIRHAIAALHAEEAARLAADLERHRAAHRAARAAIRPTLQLVAPPAPIEQGRLPL